MVEIRKAGLADLPQIQAIVYETWPVAYGEILSKAQLEYMLETFYNLSALEQTMATGQDFHIAVEGTVATGFIGIQAFAERDELKLHKFYVSPQFQGKGIGNVLFEKAISEARKFNCSRFFLNVNRFNKAIQYYETKGMRICKQEDIAIGNGYLMEDYVMELMLK